MKLKMINPNSSSSCLCGCGKKTSIRRGKPCNYIKNHHRVKRKPCDYCGTPFIFHIGKREKFCSHKCAWASRPKRVVSTNGYIYVQALNHPRANNSGKYVFEHILTMEKHLGRFLSYDEIVHHKNGERQDNRLENLEITTRSEHNRHHNKNGKRKLHFKSKLGTHETKKSEEEVQHGIDGQLTDGQGGT